MILSNNREEKELWCQK